MTAAAALVRVPHGVLSNQSAALVHGLPLVEEDTTVHLTVPRNHSGVLLSGATVTRRPLPESDVQERADGTRVTSVERTITDLARALPLAQAVVVADGALRAGLVQPGPLRERLRRERGHGSGTCRQVADLVDPACESVLESLVRVLLWTGPWPRPVTQHPLHDPTGRRAVRLDFAWPSVRLAVEADGFAFHSDRAAYRSDRARLNLLASLGWLVLRFTYEDAVSRPGYITALVSSCLGLTDTRLPAAA